MRIRVTVTRSAGTTTETWENDASYKTGGNQGEAMYPAAMGSRINKLLRDPDVVSIGMERE